jgi:hypothetical protein
VDLKFIFDSEEDKLQDFLSCPDLHCPSTKLSQPWETSSARRGSGSPSSSWLLALRPTDDELAESAEWVSAQDAYEGFTTMISEVAEHVRRRRA